MMDGLLIQITKDIFKKNDYYIDIDTDIDIERPKLLFELFLNIFQLIKHANP